MAPKTTKALIVGDMQRDFMEAGGALFCGPDARKIIEPVRKTIEEMRSEGALIVFVQDTHVPDDPEFDLWPPHCVDGSHGHEIIPQLEVRPEDVRVKKPHYSAFFGTNLHEILKSHGVDELHLVGDFTSMCILFSAEDAFNNNYKVVVHSEAVVDLDADAHDFALRHMEKILGVAVV